MTLMKANKATYLINNSPHTLHLKNLNVLKKIVNNKFIKIIQ